MVRRNREVTTTIDDLELIRFFGTGARTNGWVVVVNDFQLFGL